MASITSKGIDIERKEILQGYGKPPPEGLIPVGGNGIYLSPNLAKNKPVSPFDCNQWPDSPYCGGVPWTRTPIGFDIDFGFDGCGAWVTGTPIIGFTKLPQISAVWRRSGECRDQMQPKNVGELPKEIDENSLSTPPSFPLGIPSDTRVIAAFVFDELEYAFNDKIGDWTETQKTQVVSSFSKLSVPGDYTVGYPGSQPPLAQSVATAYATLTKNSSIKEVRNGITLRDFSGTSSSSFILNIHPTHKLFKDSSGRTWDLRINNMFRSPTTGDTVTNEGPSTGSHLEIAVGRYGDLVNYYSTRSFHTKYSHRDRDGDGADYVLVKNCRLAALHITDFKNEPKAPPPDYKKRKCECMQCCGSGQAQDRRRDQDNAEILKLLREIRKNQGQFPIKVDIFDANESQPGAQSKTLSLPTISDAIKRNIQEVEKALKCIGIDQLPIYVPSSVIEDESNGLLGDIGDLKNKIVRQRIESLAEFNTWKTKNDYEIFGQWQEVIVVEDSDPTKKGSQPKRVVLPNMAKTFKELILLNSTQIKVLGMMMDTMLKMYIDLLNTKVSTAVSEQILRDVQDFLDYPTVEKELKVPVGATIPSADDPVDDKEDIERFLKNSDVYAKFDDWTGEGSLHDMMIELLQAAKQISAQFFNRV